MRLGHSDYADPGAWGGLPGIAIMLDMDSAIGCPTLSFNSNYLQNGLMEFDLVCGH
eukprot:COSAG04_NODE_2198_length_4550_cov_171.247360_3_plen_56_part_00